MNVELDKSETVALLRGMAREISLYASGGTLLEKDVAFSLYRLADRLAVLSEQYIREFLNDGAT